MQNFLTRTKHCFLEVNLQSTLQNLSSHKQFNQFRFIMLVEMTWRRHGSLLFNAKFSFFKNFLNFFGRFYYFSLVEGNANDFPLHTRMKTRSCWRLKYLHTGPPLGSQRNLPLKKWEIFQIATWPYVGHLVKGSCGFKGGSLSQKISTWQSFVSMVFSKWRYNLFNLLSDLTRPPHWGVMQIYGWEFLAVCKKLDRFREQRHCDTGYML